MARVFLKGPWTYRGDLVAVKRVTSQMGLNPELVTHEDLWVQFFDVPANITNEGLAIMAGGVGIPVSTPIEGYVAGRRFVKMRVSVNLAAPLRDRVRITHQNLGEIPILCSYEKISRVCLFCGLLGHEMATCPDYLTLARLAQKQAQNPEYDLNSLLSPKRGKWIVNSAMIPKPEKTLAQGIPKRAFSAMGQHHQGHTTGPSVNPNNDLAIYREGNMEEEGEFTSTPLKRPRPACQNSPAQDI